MQLHLTLEADAIALPINYRPLIHGMIYHALSIHPDYSERLHNRNSAGSTHSFKGFTFSQLHGNYSISSHTITFLGSVTLEIRSYEPLFVMGLRDALAHADAVVLGEASLHLVRCEVSDVHAFQPAARIRMRAPVVAYRTLEDRRTEFYAPDEPRFYAGLLNNARNKWQYYRGDAPFELAIAPCFSTLPKKQFSSFRGTYITGWYGDYALEGTPEAIDMLYQTGLGAKNSEGFGLFDIDGQRV